MGHKFEHGKMYEHYNARDTAIVVTSPPVCKDNGDVCLRVNWINKNPMGKAFVIHLPGPSEITIYSENVDQWREYTNDD